MALVVGASELSKELVVEERAREVMAAIRDCLTAIGPAASTWTGHRITLIATDKVSHDAYQDTLFATFPE